MTMTCLCGLNYNKSTRFTTAHTTIVSIITTCQLIFDILTVAYYKTLNGGVAHNNTVKFNVPLTFITTTEVAVYTQLQPVIGMRIKLNDRNKE